MSQDPLPSTRPYLIRALHEWCSDNGFTPHLVVAVDATVRVPREFVQDGKIVLNSSYEATSNLQLGNETIEFKARFGGVPRDVQVPIDHVLAIFAHENGHGMAFEAPAPLQQSEDEGTRVGLKVVEADATGSEQIPESGDSEAPSEPPKPGGSPTGRPALRRVK